METLLGEMIVLETVFTTCYVNSLRHSGSFLDFLSFFSHFSKSPFSNTIVYVYFGSERLSSFIQMDNVRKLMKIHSRAHYVLVSDFIELELKKNDAFQ